MGDWAAFWSMGGYASYVWSAYGIAAGVITLNIVLPVWCHRAIKRRIRREACADD
tara:strand:- start:335 stop:499 length:165 start_codon:yes stop_codon:yes gene_type:complete